MGREDNVKREIGASKTESNEQVADLVEKPNSRVP
jgi:hypothetical protein